MAADLDLVRRIAAPEQWLAVVATTRPDGSVHASLVNAGLLEHPLTGEPVVGFVVRGDTRKLAHLRRTQRVTVVWRRGWTWASVE
ncbi:MAG: pyridoxamine 5'-phosphate oxidase family protein, partial [Acidimicrobiales bacterium]